MRSQIIKHVGCTNCGMNSGGDDVGGVDLAGRQLQQPLSEWRQTQVFAAGYSR